jgi:hypothetical protein
LGSAKAMIDGQPEQPCILEANALRRFHPDHLKDRWKVDGIDWTKERHAYWGENYSTQYEVHRLVHWEGRELTWQLLVVVERWWGPDRKRCIRNVSWCRAVSGKPDKVLAWFKKRSAG